MISLTIFWCVIGGLLAMLEHTSFTRVQKAKIYSSRDYFVCCRNFSCDWCRNKSLFKRYDRRVDVVLLWTRR